jgi:hypothetical protein
MNNDRFQIQWIAHVMPGDKIWGWFLDAESANQSPPHRRYWGLRNCYAFWAVTGKTITIKRHVMIGSALEDLQKKKLANKYQQITEQQLLTMWPTFREDLQARFIFSQLAERF